MHVVIDRNKKGWNFTLKEGETRIFSSTSPSPLFYGEYGDSYASPEAAFGACRMFLFRNAAIMDKVEGKSTMTEVQQGIVDGMVNRWNAFVARMKDIHHNHDNDDINSLQKTVPSLDKLLGDSATTIDSIISQIETDTSEEAALGEEKEYTEENVENEASVYLIRTCDKMKKMRNRLKTEFKEFLEVGALPEGPAPVPMEQTGSSRGMRKYASLLGDDPDLFADLIADIVELVRDALGGGYVRNIERTNVDGWVFMIRTPRGEYGVRIGDDALFRGVFPSGSTCAKYPYMSISFWNDVVKPSMSAVGHLLDLPSGYLLLPETVAAMVPLVEDDTRITDVLKAFNTGNGQKCACEVVTRRGRRTKGDMYCIRPHVSLSTSASTNLDERIGRLKNATMVKVVRPGSKYEGIAGAVDPERMKVRNDYLEVPVRIKFDTGLETEVWMSDEDVEVFMEGGGGVPQTVV